MTTLIIGGTGKTGRRVLDRLTAAGHPVRAVSRGSTPSFDWTDRSTWEAAIAGTDSAYVTFQPELGLPGSAEPVGDVAGLAVRLGCRRLVLLSGRGADGTRLAEQALVRSGADWTVIRSAFFTQNFTEGFWAEELAHGSLTMVEHSAREPFVDVDDVADVAVACLLDPAHVGAVHEVTGPRLVTFAEAAAEVAAATALRIEYDELPVDAYAAALTGTLPEADALGLARLFAEVLDGRNAHVTDGVRSVLGREPRDLVDVVKQAAADGARHG